MVYGITVALFFFLNVYSIFEPLEETLLDIQFQSFQRDIEEPKVVLVLIDDQSLKELSSKMGIYWPWPRELYSYLHNYLSAKGATRIVYDIILDQPDFDRPGFRGTESDKNLEISLGTYGNGVLAAYTYSLRPNEDQITSKFSYQVEGLIDTSVYGLNNLPITQFGQVANSLGSVNVNVKNESLIRKVPLFFHLQSNQFIPSLAMSTYLSATDGSAQNIKYSNNSLLTKANKIPLTETNEYLINWYSKGGGGLDEGSFDNYSFASILRNAIQFAQTGTTPNDSLIDVKDKVVFLGANAAGLADIKSTPMSPYEPFPGVEIHATVLQNLLDQDYITIIDNTNIYFRIGILIIIFLLYYGVFFKSYQVNISLSLLILFGILISGIALFYSQRVWFPTVEGTFTIALTIVVGYIVKYVGEDNEKRKIRGAFGMYIQKELVDEISESPEELKLGGQRKNLTIIFSDLEGFTSISEQYTPEELVAFLNEYLSEMTRIIFEHKGTLDKYIGDAVMAFWGAPVSHENHAFLACKCVLEMQKSLKILQKKWKAEGKPTPGVRFGINTGEVVVGNMGSLERFNYTVLGDHVNLAARLEPANKDFGTHTLISEFTRALIGDKFLVREAGLIKVKGRDEAIKVFELLGEAGEEGEAEKRKFITDFEKALILYYSNKLDEAASVFMEFTKNYGEDPLSDIYLSKIAYYQAFPPEKWTGIHEQISK
tara:strand:- start:15946 stop:18084 length:2139 start_codon:yes stop_codon:yes gene_type:complete